jgi:hypothetical protein
MLYLLGVSLANSNSIGAKIRVLPFFWRFEKKFRVYLWLTTKHFAASPKHCLLLPHCLLACCTQVYVYKFPFQKDGCVFISNNDHISNSSYAAGQAAGEKAKANVKCPGGPTRPSVMLLDR